MTQGPIASAPTIYIRGSSQWRLATDQMHDGGRAYLCKLDGTPFGSGDLTCFATITRNSDGAVTYAQAQMSFETTNPITDLPGQLGVWALTIPTTAVPQGGGNALADVEIHGPGGLTDTTMGHLYANLVERDAASVP